MFSRTPTQTPTPAPSPLALRAMGATGIVIIVFTWPVVPPVVELGLAETFLVVCEYLASAFTGFIRTITSKLTHDKT